MLTMFKRQKDKTMAPHNDKGLHETILVNGALELAYSGTSHGCAKIKGDPDYIEKTVYRWAEQKQLSVEKQVLRHPTPSELAKLTVHTNQFTSSGLLSWQGYSHQCTHILYYVKDLSGTQPDELRHYVLIS